MSAALDRPPAQRRRLGSPEIQITGQIINGHEVITIDDSEDEALPAPQPPAQGPSRRRIADDNQPARRRQRRSPSLDLRARFEQMRHAHEVGEALTHRNRMRAAIDAGEVEFAIIPDDDEDDLDYVPDDERIFSPTPPPANNSPNNRRGIALGGALFIHDGLRINFEPAERVNRFLARLPIFGMGDNRDLLAQAAPPAIPAYKSEFTHPIPQHGCTHSFPAVPASPDRKGKSVHPPPTINFQCSKCHDNLYLSAPDAGCRVYILRCGHMLDGKCVQLLSTPPIGLFPQTENIEVLGVDVPARSRGKGGRGGRGRAPAKPRGKKRKRGQEEEKLTWEWACPAPACARAHTSQWSAVGGEGHKGAWVPHAEEGAILLYL